MKDLDIKSLIIGFLVCFVFGVVSKLLATEDEIGRYQIVARDGYPSALDTTTGIMYIIKSADPSSHQQFKYKEVRVRTPIGMTNTVVAMT